MTDDALEDMSAYLSACAKAVVDVVLLAVVVSVYL
jgi:hypothetical protein